MNRSFSVATFPTFVQFQFLKQLFNILFSLAPVWLVGYVYGSRSFQVVVNGVTGQIAGTRPWSWIKVTLLVIVILTIVAIIASILIASSELEGGALPQDTTVWLRQANDQAPSGDRSPGPGYRIG